MEKLDLDKIKKENPKLFQAIKEKNKQLNKIVTK